MQNKLHSLHDTPFVGLPTSEARCQLTALQSEYVADDRAVEDKEDKDVTPAVETTHISDPLGSPRRRPESSLNA